MGKLFKINKETNEFIGFYDEDIHGIEADEIEYFSLTDEKWQELLDLQSEGLEIRILNQFTITKAKSKFIPEIGNYKKNGNSLGMVKPIYDYREHKYCETATEDEIEKYAFERNKALYVKEKEIFDLVKLDNELGLVPDETLEECKDYMRLINPFVEVKLFPSVDRPAIFDRYEPNKG